MGSNCIYAISRLMFINLQLVTRMNTSLFEIDIIYFMHRENSGTLVLSLTLNTHGQKSGTAWICITCKILLFLYILPFFLISFFVCKICHYHAKNRTKNILIIRAYFNRHGDSTDSTAVPNFWPLVYITAYRQLKRLRRYLLLLNKWW